MASRLQFVRPTAMRRITGLRFVTVIAILLVAVSVPTRAIGSSECECCGPLVTVPAAPVAPCCVVGVQRRMATFDKPHMPMAPVPTAELVVPYAPLPSSRVGRRGHPPGMARPPGLRTDVLRL